MQVHLTMKGRKRIKITKNEPIYERNLFRDIVEELTLRSFDVVILEINVDHMGRSPLDHHPNRHPHRIPANSNPPHSHQVESCQLDIGWDFDIVFFP